MLLFLSNCFGVVDSCGCERGSLFEFEFEDEVDLLNRLGADVHGLELGHRGCREVASVVSFPFVVLLDQNRACEAQQVGWVREHAQYIGAACDRSVDAFQRIR